MGVLGILPAPLDAVHSACSECCELLLCLSCKRPLVATERDKEELCVKHKIRWLQTLNNGEDLSDEIREHIIKYHCCSKQCRNFAAIFETLDGTSS